MPGPADFAKLVPGFDFLQGLMKTAGQSLPNMGQWIAPTLDPDELEKRIEQLRTVQFWLEQNAKLLSTTIQALEVQRKLARTGRHRAVGMADLLIAVHAALIGLVLVHYDADFEIAAEFLDFQQRWVVERGSI